MQHLPPDDATYAKNIRKQYEALGNFVEKFELMVDEVRGICSDCIFNSNNTTDEIKPTKDSIREEDQRRRLISIAFHHQAMSAKPLFDVMRAIIADFVNYPPNYHYPERDLYRDILAHIEKEFSFLYWKRNDLLHGTWFIGARSEDDPAASTFYIQKFKTSADGLQRSKELPKDAEELLLLRDRCHDTCAWLQYVRYCLRRKSERLSTYFKLDGDHWKLFIRPRVAGTTLPRKSPASYRPFRDRPD